MSKIVKKCSFAGLPQTERGQATVLGADPKFKKFLYCCAGNVIVRDLEEPKNFYSYSQHAKKPTCAKYAPSGFYICSGDVTGKVRIWDTTQEEHLLKNEFQPISGPIKDIAWDGESKRIAVCGEGKGKQASVISWDSGNTLGSLDGMSKRATSVDLKTTRPYRALVCSDDLVTMFYKGPPFKMFSSLREGSRFPDCCRFSPDGKVFAIANMDGSVHIYEAKEGEHLGVLAEDKAHSMGIYSLSFNKDGSELITASADKTIKLWNTESRQLVVDFDMGKSESSIDYQQLGCLWAGNHILSVGLSGEIKYLDRNNPCTPLLVLSGHKAAITSVATKQGEAIFTGDGSGIIVKWNPNTGIGVRFRGKGHAAKVSDMVYNPITDQLISIGFDDKIRYTNADGSEYSNENVVSFDSQPIALAITKEGLVVVACANELVLLKNMKKVCVFPHKTSAPVRVSAQGNRIFASGEKGEGFSAEIQTCDVFDIEGDNIVKTDVSFKLKNSCTGLEISPDGSKFVICDGKEIKFYQLCDGLEKPTKVLYGHQSKITYVAWSPNSQFLVSSSVDVSIILWDMTTRKDYQFPAAHPKSIINGVDWLDDKTFVSVGEDCIVNQWSVVPK